MTTADQPGYSSNVKLTLKVGGKDLRLAKIGPAHVVLQTPEDLPSGKACIVMDVDGNVRQWDVQIIHGSVPFDENVQVKEISSNSNADGIIRQPRLFS